MKVWRILVVAALVLGAARAVRADSALLGGSGDYLIGPGDVLDISVWKTDALTKAQCVLPDGKITFPLIGEVQAAGRTVTQLKKEIEDRVARFVPDPVLSVEVQQVNSLVVYVIGRVKQPGRLVLNTNINVLQALSMAGGLNSFANRSAVKVFRKVGGRHEIFDFDYDEVAAGRNMSQNITLVRGDVVVVK